MEELERGVGWDRERERGEMEKGDGEGEREGRQKVMFSH